MVWSLVAICILLLGVLAQQLTATRTENQILKHQLALTELRLQSALNQREAEQLLRRHESFDEVLPGSSDGASDTIP